MKLLMAILFAGLFIALGCLLVFGAYKQWPALVDPSEEVAWSYSQAFIKRMFGKKFLLVYTYAIGFLFIALACIGLWNGLAK